MKDSRNRLIQTEKPFFVRFGKPVVFCFLAVALIILIVENRGLFFGVPGWYANLPVAAVLLIENAVKFWGVKS